MGKKDVTIRRSFKGQLLSTLLNSQVDDPKGFHFKCFLRYFLTRLKVKNTCGKLLKPKEHQLLKTRKTLLTPLFLNTITLDS